MTPVGAIAVDNTPDTDLDTWNDSNMSSDDEAADKIDNRLVKAQARRVINVHGSFSYIFLILRACLTYQSL